MYDIELSKHFESRYKIVPFEKAIEITYLGKNNKTNNQ